MELAKQYDPKQIEDLMYQAEAPGFHADPADPRPPYCIVIPPPNVTAALHLGHALNNTLQDILVRYRRMTGRATLWMPGTDHAGIATQTVVDKRLAAEGQPSLAHYRTVEAEGGPGREQFLQKVQLWKAEYEARILNQLKLMGCSCDWDRTRFTMDEVCARAVRATFFKLFKDGLIYRGKRLVNWDPATQTVLADDEVEHETVKGNFWYLRYPLEKAVEIAGQTVDYVTVATTRPETMLGDTAVAMNPADPRAQYLVGQKVRLPLVGRRIPIIADDHVVMPDPDSDEEKAKFSTGFLKVTPAHDPDDYQIGQRHNLPMINVMAPDGSISDRHGWTDAAGTEAARFVGMDRFAARDAIVEWFRNAGLLEDVRPYDHPVGHSYRSHVPIEPYLSDQWYVAVKKPIPGLEPATAKCRLTDDQVEAKDGVVYLKGTDVPVDSLAGLALAPLLDGRLNFTPDRYAATYRTWLENLRDWPISRQLWWGHQIPVWSKPGSHAMGEKVTDVQWRVEQREDGSVTYVCVAPGCQQIEKTLEEAGFVRDPDVLDTWFSSALWPFSTLGWPEDTPELKKFYPGDVLCTAREIITLWVSRMVMMGQYCLGDIPFRDVFIHAMIQDGEGQKMSKSLGNGVDPVDIIHSHGADAMRFTLCNMTTQTQDVRMPIDLICPFTGEEFPPAMITDKAGYRVAAPLQSCPCDPKKKMLSPYGAAHGGPGDLPVARTTSPKFDIGRNFCNKLWNATRFVMMNIEGGVPAWHEIDPSAHLADAWILSRLQQTVGSVTRALEEFRFNELADTIYHFTWDEFCDWYVEIAKSRINAGQQAPKAVLAHCLDVILRLLHPVAPFITEALWQRLNEVVPARGPGQAIASPLLVTAAWPQADERLVNLPAEQQFGVLTDLIRQVRNVRTQHNVPPSRKVDVEVEAVGPAAELVARNADLIRSQAQVERVNVQAGPIQPPQTAASVAVGAIRLYVLDIIDRQAEIARLKKQQEQLIKGLASIEGKLNNEKFVSKAPPDVVANERKRLGDYQAQLASVTASLKALE